MAATKIKQFTVSPNDAFFFDTCVWMYIFAPIANAQQYKQNIYSSLLKSILNRKATIWINSQVVAEYINASLRKEFELWKDNKGFLNADFKRDFRITTEYSDALLNIKYQINNILKNTDKCPDDFHNMDVMGLINKMQNTMDYGDMVISECCMNKNSFLVTDDSDIINSNLKIKVLTA